jgi:hypothetical protein
MNIPIFRESDITKILNCLQNHLDKIDKFDNNYELKIYKEFLYYFRNLNEIDFHALAISSSYICGTIPSTFKLSEQDLCFALKIINDKVQKNIELNDDEYLILVKCMNNSVIATSKLLHLLQPNNYPIINSRIKKYFKSNGLVNSIYKRTKSKEEEIKQYKLYRDICTKIICSEEFKHNLHFQALNKTNEKDSYSSFKVLEQMIYNF